MLASEDVALLIAAVCVITLWASLAGMFMGMNSVYGGMCWFGISLLVWAASALGLVASAVIFDLILPSSFDMVVGFGLTFYTGLFVIGSWCGLKLVPLLSANVFGRGPVWRWRLRPEDYRLFLA